MKTREQDINEAKADLFKHRAFWWVINDLQELKGPESDIISLIKQLQKRYNADSQQETNNIKLLKQSEIF